MSNLLVVPGVAQTPLVWTPTITLTTPGTFSASYSEQTSTVYRIGNLTFLAARMTFTPTVGTGTGNIRFPGLPVLPASNLREGGVVSYLSGFATWPAGSSQVGVAALASGALYLQGNGSGISGPDWTVSQLTDGASHTLRFSIIYAV